jgi:pimeloyl-ACP methyl ester carboxylesterase
MFHPLSTVNATRPRPPAAAHSLLAAIAIATAAPACHATTGETTMPTNNSSVTTPSAPNKHGYIAINGVRYYHEIHGRGEPLLMLHGGLGSTELFEPGLAELARERQVVAVDLHGHGRTELGDREISLIDQGNDMAEIVKQLGFKQVDVIGYSLGGGVALRLAVQHPDAVRRLVLVSAVFSTDGFHPEMLPQQAAVSGAMADAMKDTPIYKSYVKIAPHPEDFPKLLDRMGAYMRKTYNWADDVKKIQAPTMLVYGDSDMMRPEHIVQFYQLLGGGLKDAGWTREHMSKNRLAILPDVTHYEMAIAPQLIPTIRPFLDGKSWTDQASHK